MEIHRWTLQRWTTEAEQNLAGWQEPGGHLVATEPDIEQRALTRIELRAQIYTLRRILGEETEPREYERENHRDLQRIRDAAVQESASTK